MCCILASWRPQWMFCMFGWEMLMCLFELWERQWSSRNVAESIQGHIFRCAHISALLHANNFKSAKFSLCILFTLHHLSFLHLSPLSSFSEELVLAPCMNQPSMPEWKTPERSERERERWGGIEIREMGGEKHKSTCRCTGPRGGALPGNSSSRRSSRSSNNRLSGAVPACLTHWLTRCTLVSHTFNT